MKSRGGKCRRAENVRRIRAFVLLLRHSGLRIGDALMLERSRVTGDKLFLYTAKTGTPVYVPLRDDVLIALEAVPKISEQYFFWSGESKRQSATGDWQRALKGVFKGAKIPDGHVASGLVMSKASWKLSNLASPVSLRARNFSVSRRA
jgi:integrase